MSDLVFVGVGVADLGVAGFAFFFEAGGIGDVDCAEGIVDDGVVGFSGDFKEPARLRVGGLRGLGHLGLLGYEMRDMEKPLGWIYFATSMVPSTVPSE